MTTLDIRLLGEFAIFSNGAPLSAIRSQRQQSLLAYLLLHRDAPIERHGLAYRFWPDSTEEQALANLRNLLHSLKAALPNGERFVESDGFTVQWRRSSPYTLDVDCLLSSLAAAASVQDLQQALDLYVGPLLPSCYDDWIVPLREELEQKVADAVQRLIDRWEQEAAYREAIHFAHWLVRRDPLREDLYRQLMRLHALCGDRAGVKRIYRECQDVLRRELDVEPSRQTREAHERYIRTELAARPMAAQPPPPPLPPGPPPQSEPPASRPKTATGHTKALIGIAVFFALVGFFALPRAPDNVVDISIMTTDTKAEWLGRVTQDFNDAGYKTSSGRVISATMLQMSGPAPMAEAILNGNNLKPVLVSPGDISALDEINEILHETNKPEISLSDCPPIVWVPTGFAMWRPMAEALGWPATPIGWEQIVELAGDPKGWARYGHPEWGEFKFGHSHPEQSTTGFNMMASLAYAAAGKTRDLMPEDVYSDTVEDAFRQVERDTYHYGLSTRGLLTLMANSGSAYLHAATASETSFIKQMELYKDRISWAFIFPAEGTFWSDNPTCILNSSWVSREQQEASRIYRDFLLSPAAQEKAVEIGLRPARSDIALHFPISLDNGTDPGLTPQTVPPLEGVSGATRAAIIDLFRETKKKVSVAIFLDTSASMAGAPMGYAVAGTVGFLNELHKDDEIEVCTFNDAVTCLQPSGRVGDVVESLAPVIKGLAVKGNTALYDAVCTAAAHLERKKHEDELAGEARLYGAVLLSDGKDTNSVRTQNVMFSCLPESADVRGIRIYTIAYGDEADDEVLTRIAHRTNGKFYKADLDDSDSIAQIYWQISAEQ